MPWPKGKPRKGHVKKDGMPHAQRGFRLSKSLPPKNTTKENKVVAVPSLGETTRVRYNTKLAHPQYVIERCPNCGFPEADGGYCADCGWSKPMPVLNPANTVHGRLFKR